MAKNDWEPDDLLDFHYDRKVPSNREKENEDFKVFDELIESAKPKEASSQRGLGGSFDLYDDMKRYEELRKQRAPEPERAAPSGSGSGAEGFDMHQYIEPPLSSRREDSDAKLFGRYDEAAGARRGPVEELPDERNRRSAKELEALKQASQQAYDRYRSNYTKNKRKREGKTRVSRFHKVLTIIYTISMLSFAAAMTYMNVLPTGMLIAMYVILGLLSLVILVQVRKNSIRRWGKRFATLMAILMIALYGTGTAYALGTLSFLSGTSVDNEKSVAMITRDPFNVVITGLDVSGTIEEEGRSDVNMILTVNPSTAQLLMTSIPRDYEIYMSDKDNALDKLTHTGFYGVQSTILAEEQLLDITANYYVKVNFSTVEKFIDAIGGVDVYSEYEFTPVKMKDWTVKEGMNHMNGKQALAFARERKAFITGDNQRIKNQQAVFEAMFKKATSSRTMIFSYNRILTSLKDYFEMSFSSREIRSLAKMQLARFPDWKIYKNTIVGGDGLLPTYSTGGDYAYVMTQDAESIENAKTLINTVLEGGTLMTDEDGKVKVASGEAE